MSNKSIHILCHVYTTLPNFCLPNGNNFLAQEKQKILKCRCITVRSTKGALKSLVVLGTFCHQLGRHICMMYIRISQELDYRFSDPIDNVRHKFTRTNREQTKILTWRRYHTNLRTKLCLESTSNAGFKRHEKEMTQTLDHTRMWWGIPRYYHYTITLNWGQLTVGRNTRMRENHMFGSGYCRQKCIRVEKLLVEVKK